MSRFIFVILANLWRVFYIVPYMRYKANRPAQFSAEDRYALCKRVVAHMQKSGKIHTTVSGLENLPDTKSYVLYANHQGKYDALSIVDMHDRPLSLVMDEAKSHTILVAQFLDLCESKRLVLSDVRQGMKIMREITRELEDGRVFLIFPEGGYEDNHNMVCNFKGGSFRCAIKAKVPIVPVALIDSWKAFEGKKLNRVDTQVHFLKPLLYEDYKNMKTQQIAQYVQDTIQEDILNSLQGEDLETLKKQLANRECEVSSESAS